MAWKSFDPFGDLIQKEVENTRAGLPADARRDWPGQESGEPKEDTPEETELTAKDYIDAGY